MPDSNLPHLDYASASTDAGQRRRWFRRLGRRVVSLVLDEPVVGFLVTAALYLAFLRLIFAAWRLFQ